METPKKRLQNFKKEGLLSKKYNYSQSGFARFTFGIVALVELRHHIRGGNHQRLPLWIMWTAWVSAQTKNNDELHLHTSGLCEHLGFLARQGKQWWAMSPHLWIVQTPGVSKQSGHNAEQHLHTSGLWEHLGFPHRQREQRWTSQHLWIVGTPGVSKQSENNAGVHWTMLPHLMQADTKITVVYEHPFMG